MPSCHAAARPGAAQPAHTEEALDQPVVLEHLDAPGDALVEQALVQLGVLRVRAITVGPHRDVARVIRLGREVPAVHDQRPSAQALAQSGDSVGQHVGTRLPANHARRRDHPLVGVERAQDLVRIPPRVELHCTDGRAACFEVVDSRDDRRRDVESGFGAVPVRAAVVGPVGEPGTQHVGVARGCGDIGALAEDPVPTVETVARSVAGDDRELGDEAFLDLVDVAVPTDAQARVRLFLPRGNADDLFVKRQHRRDQHRATVRCDEAEREHYRGPEGQEPPTRQCLITEDRQREFRVLVAERAQSCGRATRFALRRQEMPRDRRRREVARADATARLGRPESQQEHRFVGEYRDLTRDPVESDTEGRLRGRHERGGLRSRDHERRRSEPVGLVPPDAEHRISRQAALERPGVDGLTACVGFRHGSIQSETHR